jgi:heat-inducible transcriptional repressor
MITDRQKELLKLIIEDYIKTVKPVSSSSLCEALDCSSATVRSEMSILEEVGLIEKTHTSSGRIPSEKGYRYYVDYIMKPKELTGDDVLKLQLILNNKSLMLNDAISKSMEIVSEMTNYASIVLGKASIDNRISKIEVVPINEQNLVAVIITDKGHVEHRNIFMDELVSLEEIKQTVDLINKLIIGTPLDEVGRKLEFEIKPIIAQYVKQHEVLYNAFYNAFSDFTKEPNIKMSGSKNILMQPEFDDSTKLRDILNKLDNHEMIENIETSDTEIKIYIGSENEFDENITIIKTKYVVNGEEGTIAIVGPKRMEYDRVITLLDYIKKNIER